MTLLGQNWCSMHLVFLVWCWHFSQISVEGLVQAHSLLGILAQGLLLQTGKVLSLCYHSVETVCCTCMVTGLICVYIIIDD